MQNGKQNIKAAIKAKGYTQTILADRLRCSIPFLCMVIAGKRTSKRIRGGLAAYLGKSIADLWPEDKKNTSAPAGRNTPSGGCLVGTDDPSRG